MPSVEDKLAKSLTAQSVELIPYLPYLLQDLWELGSSPQDIIGLILKHIQVSAKTKVLDLACGKGAVSVEIAKVIGCRVKGIDIIPEFIAFADKKAQEFGVENLCEFKVGDINEAVKIEKDFDIVIHGAVGEVLGNQEETLEKLSLTIKKGGYALIDDAYGKVESAEIYITKEQWLEIIKKSGYHLIEDLPGDEGDLSATLDEQIAYLAKRINELKIRHPQKASLFDEYFKSQLAECNQLENDILGVTMLLKKL